MTIEDIILIIDNIKLTCGSCDSESCNSCKVHDIKDRILNVSSELLKTLSELLEEKEI